MTTHLGHSPIRTAWILLNLSAIFAACALGRRSASPAPVCALQRQLSDPTLLLGCDLRSKAIDLFPEIGNSRFGHGLISFFGYLSLPKPRRRLGSCAGAPRLGAAAAPLAVLTAPSSRGVTPVSPRLGFAPFAGFSGGRMTLWRGSDSGDGRSGGTRLIG